MPIPSPQGNEEKDKFISRCIRTVSKADPERERDQVIAMCIGQWNRTRTSETEKNVIYTVRKAIGYNKTRANFGGKLPKGVIGVLERNDEGYVDLQRLEFSKEDGWTIEKASKWVDDHYKDMGIFGFVIDAKNIETFDIETYDPSEEKDDRVVIHMYAKAIAWYNRIKRNQKLKFSEKQVVDFLKKMVNEMNRRDLEPLEGERILREIKDEAVNPYAPVTPFGHNEGEEVTLEDITSRLDKPIVLKRPYIVLTGGICNWQKTKGDIDNVWMQGEWIHERDHPVLFRIGRALGDPNLVERFSSGILLDEFHGAFTHYYPLYDLVLVPSAERHLVRLQRLRDPEGEREANTSKRENKVEAGRFVIPPKPRKGYFRFPELATEMVMRWFDEDDFPLYVQKVYDGARGIWMKDGQKNIVRSDDGEDISDRFPNIIKWTNQHLPEKVTLDFECEMWKEGVHVPREETSGHLRRTDTADDSNLVLNIFDILFLNKDLHELPYSDRYDLLKKIDWPQSTNEKPKTQSFNLTPSEIVKTKEELTGAIKRTAEYVASEGAIAKSGKATYSLNGKENSWVKYKKMADLFVAVLGNIETRTSGVFNLETGVTIPRGWKVPEKFLREVKGKTYMYVGKTFNVTGRKEEGSVIRETFHTLFHHIKGDEQYLTVYEPGFAEVVERAPMSADEAVKEAKRIELYEVKKLSVNLQKFTMSDEAHNFTMQHHFRGKSCHIDFRTKIDDYLQGFTIFDLKPDTITEPITTLAEAKSIDKSWNRYFKMTDKVQTQVEAMRTKLQITWKTSEPSEWLNFEGVQEKGAVGGSENYEGVFHIVNKGTVYFGAQKPGFTELFLESPMFNGRWVIRRIPNPYVQERPREVFLELMWKPEDQTPYVLTTRARQKKWIPPKGISCLPPNIREKIPTKYKYWVRENKSDALAIRDGLIKAIQRGEISGVSLAAETDPPEISRPKSVPFVIQHIWWKGQQVVRRGPSQEYWFIKFEPSRNEPLMEFVLTSSPLEEITGGIDGIYKDEPDHSWMTRGEKTEEIKPGEKGNPTKNTPAWIEMLDRGRALILESNESFVKVNFHGKSLKGLYVFARQEPTSNMWTFEHSEVPEG